jgi:DNA-directed RNA polymerase subunit beta'
MRSSTVRSATARVGRTPAAAPVGLLSVRLGIASAETIRAASHGEVLKAWTVHFLTLRPEPGGLFCQKIFGPERDFECRCGRRKGARLEGAVCSRCGVEVGRSNVRRERMGHIELAAPVAHSWFTAGRPSILGRLLDLPARQVEEVVYFARTIARPRNPLARARLVDRLGTHPRIRSLDGKRTRDIVDRLGRNEVLALKEAELDAIDPERQWLDAGMGAEAILQILDSLDLGALSERLGDALRGQSGDLCQHTQDRITLIEGLRASGNNPASMILTVLPVLPPDLRPIVPSADGDRAIGSDLNDLYLSVLYRNNRLKHLLECGAPEIIIRNEKRMLQEAVDSLIDNRGGRAVARRSNRNLRSLSDVLKGKQGRFRQNLLGKRVDYSGRSVIVVGPELKLHQCGLPKRMALELFEPFVVHALIDKGLAQSIKSAKRLIALARPEVWDVLEEVIRTRPVLLNRAPTLHRLGIQAFEPVLIEGNAIQIHPLVCAAFNADFDGDQMAVHVPLSREAVAEARQIMLSTHNLLSPASGEPIIAPTLDIVLGCYYLTDDIPLARGEKIEHVFGSAQEARYAYDLGVIKLQQHIKVRVPYAKPRATLVPQATDILGSGSTDVGPALSLTGDDVVTHTDVMPVSTTATESVPRFEAGSSAAGRGRTEIIETTAGRIIFDEILPAGVGVAITGGIDFINDKMDRKMLKAVVARCCDVLGNEDTAEVVDNIKRIGFEYATQSGITIAVNDLRVPAEKTGLIKKAEANIREIDGEYDTGLLTEQERHEATVEVWSRTTEDVQKAIQDEFDRYGSVAMMATSGAKGNVSQITQMAGMRGLMTDPSGRIIDLPIRSSFREGLTLLEYFISTHGARKGLADRALRTANSGYLMRRLIDVAQDVIVLEEDCGTRMGVWLNRPEAGSPEAFRERIVGRHSAIDLGDPETGETLAAFNEEIDSAKAARIDSLGLEGAYVRSALTCQAKRGLCRYCYGRSPATGSLVELRQAVGIIAAQSIGEPGSQLTMRTFHTGGAASGGGDITSGLRRVEDLFEARAPTGQALISELDGIAEIVHAGSARCVRVKNTERYSDEYDVPAGAELLVKKDDIIGQGTILARLPALASGNDEAAPEVRKPTSRSKKKAAEEVPAVRDGDVVARISGRVVAHSRNHISVLYEETDEREYPVPATVRLRVENGDPVQAGQPLTEGSLDPQDILRISGPEAVQRYLVFEVQKIYRSQGVTINDKHIEVIARQMLRNVRVDAPGDTPLLPGDIVDGFAVDAINSAVIAQGGEPATSAQILLGVTQAALRTESFLAAAAFQDTTRVLTQAAIRGKTDHLVGLKEHVMIGKLIAARTPIDLPSRIRVRPAEVDEALRPATANGQLPPDRPVADVETSDESGSEEDEPDGEIDREPSAQELRGIEREGPLDGW